MKKIITVFTTFVLLITFVTSIQGQKKEFSIASFYANPVFPANLGSLQWVGDAGYFAYKTDSAIVKRGVKNDDIQVIVDKTTLNTLLEENGFEYKLRAIPNFKFTDQNTLFFTYSNQLFKYGIKDNTLALQLSYSPDGENVEIEYTTMAAAYTIDDDLYIKKGDKEIRITHDGGNGIVNGKTVHRNEFGIEDGIFWSPKGNLLSFYRKDESMVSEYPLVDITTRIATVNYTRYPMAGMTSEEVTVGVYNIATGQTVFLETGMPTDQYLTNITWDPSENYIYIAVLNRGQDHMKLVKYDVKTGKPVKNLFEEKNERYVEPEHGPVFFSGLKDQFLWYSERDGHNHLYLYDIEGNLLQQVTSGPWEVTEIAGYANDFLYYISTEESAIERHLYRINLQGKKKSKITLVKGTHNVIMHPKGTYVLDNYSNSDNIASEYALLTNKGKLAYVIAENIDPMAGFDMGETIISTLKTDDNTDLYYRMILPPDFDKTKKYPVFYYVYGGPHSQLVNDSWLGGSGLFLQEMAAKGYIVFTIDNRGTSYRGFDFESMIHRNLGSIEVGDQMQGVNYLKSLPYVDQERMALHGWSYGGFMTISMILKNPGIFKVAVAGGPVIDWKYYEVMYGERYMDTPEENPEGYKESNLLNHMKNLDARLLVIHGTIDPVVVWQNSLTFIDKSIKENKMVDYFVYPGHEHNVGGRDRLHLYRKIARYVEDYL